MTNTTAQTTTTGYADLDAAWDRLEAAALSLHIATATSHRPQRDMVRRATWSAMVDAAQAVAAITGWDWAWAYERAAADTADIIRASTEIAVHPVTLLPVPAHTLDPQALATARTTAQWCAPGDLAPRPAIEEPAPAAPAAPTLTLVPAPAAPPAQKPARPALREGQTLFEAVHPWTGETVYCITYDEDLTWFLFAARNTGDGVEYHRSGATTLKAEKAAIKAAKKRYPIGDDYRVARATKVTAAEQDESEHLAAAA